MSSASIMWSKLSELSSNGFHSMSTTLEHVLAQYLGISIERRHSEALAVGIGLASLATATLLFLQLLKKGKRDQSPFAHLPLPPGPPGWPLLGNIDCIDFMGSAYRKYIQMQAKYGDIICLNVLGQPVVVLNSYTAIKDGLVKGSQAFDGRILDPYLKHITQGSGIVDYEGPAATQHRRFALQTLRDQGLGKNVMEETIVTELEELVDTLIREVRETRARLGKGKGANVWLRMPVNMAIANIFSKLMYSGRNSEDAEFPPFLNAASKVLLTPASQSTFVHIFFKILRHLPGDYWHVKNAERACIELNRFSKNKIAQYKEKVLGGGDIPPNIASNYFDAYFSHKHENDTKFGHGNHVFGEFELRGLTRDLFVAGSETTLTTITWSLVLIARYPEIQRRVQRELDEVLQGRSPSMADRTRLKYVDAVLSETQRYPTAGPFGLPHSMIDDAELHGYRIPKGAILLINIYAVHHDPAIWPDPEHFNPANFYDEATEKLRNTEYLISFSVGRRSCIGEALAKQELWMLFCGLLQRFDFARPDAAELPERLPVRNSAGEDIWITREEALSQFDELKPLESGVLRMAPQLPLRVTPRAEAQSLS